METTLRHNGIIIMIPTDILQAGGTLDRNGRGLYNSLTGYRMSIKAVQLVAQPLVPVLQQTPVSVNETMMNFISKAIHKALGSNKLHHYEAVCLTAWSSNLSGELQQKLERQKIKFDLVQRQANGMKSVFYSVSDPQYQSWTDNDLFPLRDENQKVFSGTLTGTIGDITESVKFYIYLHRGRLSSIEFTSEPGALASLSEGLSVERQDILADLV
jgi:hypothetical protein